MDEIMEFDGNKPRFISYYEHEAEIARSEQHSRRWMIAALIAFVALVLSNAGWIIHESMYMDEVTVEQEATDNSSPVYLNGTGEMTVNGNGQADSN